MEDNTHIINIFDDDHSDHVRQLEEIDQEQRHQEEVRSMGDETVFAEAVVEALDTENTPPQTPLLAQEEIEDEDPPRINLTAVVCTAIVAVCATIILCVAAPWKDNSDSQLAEVITAPKEEPARQVDEQTPEKTETVPVAKSEPAKPAQPVVKTETTQKATEVTATADDDKKSGLPLLKTTKTKSANPYNNLRLLNASSRKLTEKEVNQMSKQELALARNAIYARHGYQFNQPELKEFFAAQSWFKPSNIKIEDVKMNEFEVANVKLIKAREQSLQ